MNSSSASARKWYGRISVLLVICAGAYAWFVLVPRFIAPCARPIEYRFGTIDPRFGVSKDSLSAIAKQASGIWSNSIHKTLFAYNPEGALTINLIYDARQATTEQNKKLEQDIAQADQTREAIDAQYKMLNDEFDAQLKAYNEQVAYWNTRGGAPRREYDALQAQKAELVSLQQQINQLATRHNYLANQENITASTINQSAGKEFEEGQYISDNTGERIDIYEFQNRAELVRVLSHEFGHALGLDHNDNPDSIMYRLNESKNDTPTAEDLAALKARCKISS